MGETSGFQRAGWVNNTNIYEVNLRQYTPEGTINAFIPQLDRLKEMGVHTLWFMPLTPISKKNRKGTLGSYYACSDYVSVNPEFGTIDDLKDLVNRAHEMGFKLIIDWVANHTGWDHVWTVDQPEFYKKNETTGDFKAAEGMDDIIELDFSNPALRHAMINAMRWWIDNFDIDGFRCDLAFWVALDFWKEARTELEKTRTLFWFGEFDALDKPEYCSLFDASYTWTFMHQSEQYAKNEIGIHQLKHLLQRYQSDSKHIPVWFTSNHDENSWNGTELEKYGDLAKAFAVLTCTWRGIPMIYSGQEFCNNKRLKFFDKDLIEWDSAKSLIDFYRQLLNLHADHPALNANVGCRILSTNADEQVLAFIRTANDRSVVTMLNLSTSFVSFSLNEKIDGSFTQIFSHQTRTPGQQEIFELPASGFEIFIN